MLIGSLTEKLHWRGERVAFNFSVHPFQSPSSLQSLFPTPCPFFFSTFFPFSPFSPFHSPLTRFLLWLKDLKGMKGEREKGREDQRRGCHCPSYWSESFQLNLLGNWTHSQQKRDEVLEEEEEECKRKGWMGMKGTQEQERGRTPPFFHPLLLHVPYLCPHTNSLTRILHRKWNIKNLVEAKLDQFLHKAQGLSGCWQFKPLSSSPLSPPSFIPASSLVPLGFTLLTSPL